MVRYWLQVWVFGLFVLAPCGAVAATTLSLTIGAFTDAGTPAGSGSIFQLNGSGAPLWLGTLPAD